MKFVLVKSYLIQICVKYTWNVNQKNLIKIDKILTDIPEKIQFLKIFRFSLKKIICVIVYRHKLLLLFIGNYIKV